MLTLPDQIASYTMNSNYQKGKCLPCKKAYLWLHGLIQLKDARCPCCGGNLQQTTWLLRNIDWYLISSVEELQGNGKNEPNYEDAERCIAIRKKGKTGQFYPREDHQFCVEMLHKYPDWYDKTEERVFNETVPFGSTVKWSDFNKPKKATGGGSDL